MPKVRYLFLVLLVLGGLPDRASAQTPDRDLLRKHGLVGEDSVFLDYLRERTLSKEDRARLADLAGRLGSDSFAERERATRELIRHGSAALPHLLRLKDSPDLEARRRARLCLEQIESGTGPALSAAVVRKVVARNPAGALEVLLAYLPFADGDLVEEEVFAALLALGLRDGRAGEALVGALRDAEPLRRAAAASVVARSEDAGQRKHALALLKDREARVRFHAAHGLLAGHPRTKAGRAAVPVLIGLVVEAPPGRGTRPRWAWQAEDLLYSLAGEHAPGVSLGTAGEEQLRAWRAAWEGWWKKHAATVDLARATSSPSFRGLVLVCEMHGSQIWEIDRGGKVLWKLDGLSQPRTAQVLPGGRVLVGEASINRVTERDRATGKILWSYAFKDAAYVERLRNGNTFVGNHRQALEVTPEGKEVFNYTVEAGFGTLHSMYRKANGHLICLSMSGILREVDREGKKVFEIKLDNAGRNWCGVQALAGGRFLVVDYNKGEVWEIDRAGKVLWKFHERGMSYALRLPSGNTLICGFGSKRVLEVNKAGKVLWEKAVATSPWRAHIR